MTTRREELLAVINEARSTDFIALIKLHNSRNDPFNFDEIIQSLSRKQYEEMWNDLSEMCTGILMSFDQDHDESPGYERQQYEVLSGITTMAICSITVDKPNLIAPLIQVAVMLHGILLAIPEHGRKLQSSIAHLCESWFLADLDGKDELVTSMLPYFIIKALAQGLVVDVKRLWSLRASLLLMDFEDETSCSLRASLQQCFVHPVFLKAEEGRKFLSFLFGMHPSFIEEIHKTIKNQIPSCPVSTLVVYGEIYFKAWRAAKDVYLKKIETFCLQDLMFNAIHAQRTGKHSMAYRLKKLLNFFHQQKKHPEVDNVLLKLYEPIIWRACKVANPSVRANAAAIFFDVFPLNSSSANIAQSDELLQRQFDVIGDLLNDPSPTVRATAVHGVFHIVALFWEVIPAHVVKELVTKILQSSAYDVSSSAVRVAVFQGVKYVLDNRLCHPLLKSLLPNLKNLLHDNSEKVRIAFLDVLLKVKGMRSIKFWSIAPIGHLLSRLEVEQSAPTIRRLVKLLMNSFHPLNKESHDLLARCTELWKANAQAARKFYQYAHLQMSLTTAVRFLLLLCKYLVRCLACADDDTCESLHDDGTPEDVDKENDASSQVDTDEHEYEAGGVDSATIAGLLETCVIIWEGIKDQIDEPSHATLKLNLNQQFAKAIPKIFKIVEDARCQSALTLLAAHLSPTLAPSLSRHCMSVLSSMNEETPAEVYGPLLECLCSWGRGRDVLELINDRLLSAFEEGPVQSETSRKKRKTVSFSIPQTKSSVSLDFLDWIMASPRCRSLIFVAKDNLRILSETLKNSLKYIERYLNDFTTYTDSTERRDFLNRAFNCFCRLEIHFHSHDKILNDSPDLDDKGIANDNILISYKNVLKWCDGVLLRTLSDSSNKDEYKRRSGNHVFQPDEFIISILKNFLMLLAELVVIGVTNPEFNMSMATFISSLLDSEKTVVLLPEVGKLMYQINLAITCSDDNANVDFKPIKIILENIFNATVTYNHREKPKILVVLRALLTEMFKTYLQNNSLTPMNARETFMFIITNTMLKDLVAGIELNPSLTSEKKMEDLPDTSSLLLDIILKSKRLIRFWIAEVIKCIRDLQEMEYEAMAYLLWIVISNGNWDEKLRICLNELQKIVEGLENKDDDSPDFVHKTKRLILESCQNMEETVVE